MKVLVTGGAGFIGSHLVDALVQHGYDVRILDKLDSQVHGSRRETPDYLNRQAEFVWGDVNDQRCLADALEEVQVVFHEAAAVGVGQSMYQIRRYVAANVLGTANLLEVLTSGSHRVKKLIIASSVSIYGEGKYDCARCGVVTPDLRRLERLAEGQWEPQCPNCSTALRPIPTDESTALRPGSVYAITKRDQEEMALCIGAAYGIPTVALRYFNVYGPRQSLSNPYTGVAAIFSARLLNHNPPIIFEDGLQTRDFIHVSDVVRANMLALEREDLDHGIFNVGTGRALTVLELAEMMMEKLGFDGRPEIAGRFREGDIRHCSADISRIGQVLGFHPEVRFEQGIDELAEWIKDQTSVDFVERAIKELDERSLIR